MKIVFFGTPDYVIPVLEKLHKYHEIVAVVTQSPKPVGRDKKIEYSPVDKFAYKHKIPIYFDANEVIKNKIDADMGVLESYGNILSNEVINYFPHGIINIHPSLLPRWRGAVPVPATLLAGDEVTGGTVIKLDSQVDHGPILSSFKEEILPDDDVVSLRKRIFERSGDILIELIPAYVKNKITLKKQDESQVTFTTRIKKDDAFIPFEFIKNAMEINNLSDSWEIPFIKGYKTIPDASFINRFVKAMKPWPIAWTKLNIKDEEKRLKILNSHINLESGYLELDEVQLEGKKPTTWKQFLFSYSASI